MDWGRSPVYSSGAEAVTEVVQAEEQAPGRENLEDFHVFLSDKTVDNWEKYQEANNAAKKAVGYGKLASRDGERYLYRFAKTRYLQTEDVENFFGINDEDDHLLTNCKKVLMRWCDYFEEISTMEFPHPAIPSVAPADAPVHEIIVEETEAALKKMKPGKATEPYDLETNLWKSKLWYPASTRYIVKDKKVPAVGTTHYDDSDLEEEG